jgi:type IV fimbrial biogenesis protein FimT
MKPGNKNSGFTLPELLIALGVLAILLSLAVPGVSSTIKENRLAGTLNNLITDIHFARSEAVKRDVRVIMCRSQNPNQNVPSCSGDAKNWTTGYIIFADDGNYLNKTYDNGTDTLLRRGQAATTGVSIRTNNRWDNNLEFNPNGTTNEDNLTALMAICDDRAEDRGRSITVAPTGIPKMKATNIDNCFP